MHKLEEPSVPSSAPRIPGTSTGDGIEGFFWECDLCSRTGSKPSGRVIRSSILKKHSRRTGAPVKCVCAQCHARFKAYKGSDPLDSIQLLKAAGAEIASGRVPSDIEGLFDKASEVTDLLAGEIRKLLARLESLTAGHNIAGSALSEIKRVYAEHLWETYPERRKRANRAISNNQLRIMIFARDKYQCVACASRKRLSIDHIVPVAHGGGDELSNLQTLCAPCNSKKGASRE